MDDRTRGCGCERCVKYWPSPRGKKMSARIDRIANGTEAAYTSPTRQDPRPSDATGGPARSGTGQQ